MEMVHRDRKCFMCFLRDRAVGHRTCLETFYNLIDALYFLDWNSFFRIIKFHQSTKCPVTFLIYQCSILFEQVITARPGRFLKQMDGMWIVFMLLSLTSHLVCTDTVKGQICI